MASLVQIVVATLAVVVACASLCVAAESRSCSLLHGAPQYTFIGGGFHMQLAVEYPVAARDVAFSFDLPKSFFIDEAEAEQLYRMEVVPFSSAVQGPAAEVLADVTAAYTPLHMTSQYFFDIEAPVFKVNYSTNHVVLTFQQRPQTPVLDTYFEATANDVAVKARLVIPIHSRYDTLDTTTPFSFKDFVLGESAYVRRCLPKISMRGNADARCSRKTFSTTSSGSSLRAQAQYQTCLELPVGVLDDLPYVYRALMGLLVAGALIVILAIR